MSSNRAMGFRESFKALHGNAKYFILIQLFFAVPYNMFSSYASLYMLALGLTKAQVGIVNSAGFFFQLLFMILSVYVVDKLGRKKTQAIGELFGWVLPTLVWAIAQDIRFFFLAAFLNGAYRFANNAYQCLMVEGYRPEERLNIFSWLHLLNLLSWFFLPLAGLLVSSLGIELGGRWIYWFSFAAFSIIWVVRLCLMKETEQGLRRKQEMKGVSLLSSLRMYIPALKAILKNRFLVTALIMKGVSFFGVTLKNTYIGILATNRLGFPDSMVAYLMMLNAVAMVLVMFFLVPRLRRFDAKGTLLIAGFVIEILGSLILIMAPPGNFFLLLLGILMIAVGFAFESPRVDAVFSNASPDEHRGLCITLMGVFSILMSIPFTYFAGLLSAVDDRLPFVLICILYLIPIAFSIWSSKASRQTSEEIGA